MYPFKGVDASTESKRSPWVGCEFAFHTDYKGLSKPVWY